MKKLISFALTLGLTLSIVEPVKAWMFDLPYEHLESESDDSISYPNSDWFYLYNKTGETTTIYWNNKPYVLENNQFIKINGFWTNDWVSKYELKYDSNAHCLECGYDSKSFKPNVDVREYYYTKLVIVDGETKVHWFNF